MPEPTSTQHGDGIVHYILAALGALAGALGVLWRRLAAKADATEVERRQAQEAAVEIMRTSAVAHETLLKETLITIRGMSEAQERTQVELRELRDRQGLIEKAVVDMAGAVNELAIRVQPIMEEMREQTRAMRDLTSAIHVLIARERK